MYKKKVLHKLGQGAADQITWNITSPLRPQRRSWGMLSEQLRSALFLPEAQNHQHPWSYRGLKNPPLKQKRVNDKHNNKVLPKKKARPGFFNFTPWWLSGKQSICNAGDLGLIDPLEEGMAAHSSVLAWRIPWTEEPGGCSPGVSRVGLSELNNNGRVDGGPARDQLPCPSVPAMQKAASRVRRPSLQDRVSHPRSHSRQLEAGVPPHSCLQL